MRAEGTQFRCGVDAGTDITAEELRASFDAIVLCGGARVPRDLPMPGRYLDGIHQAMEYLPLANRAVPGGDPTSPAPTASRRSPRQARAARGHHRRRRHRRRLPGHRAPAGCGLGHQLEILPRPPASRPGHQPWPTYPMIYRVSGAHEEGGERAYAVTTLEFLGDAWRAGPCAAARRRGRVPPGSRHRTRTAL